MATLPDRVAPSMMPSRARRQSRRRRQQNAGGMQAIRDVAPLPPCVKNPLSPRERGKGPLQQQWEGGGDVDAAEMVLHQSPHPDPLPQGERGVLLVLRGSWLPPVPPSWVPAAAQR